MLTIVAHAHAFHDLSRFMSDTIAADDSATTAVGAQIVSDVLAEIGGPLPVPPAELAALAGLYLWPHDGTCDACHTSQCDRCDCCPDCTHVPDGLRIGEGPLDRLEGWRGRVRYLCIAPAAVQERAIAMACARYLVVLRGGDSQNAPLVEYVATALCGLPRQPVSLRPLSSAPPDAAPLAAAKKQNAG